MGKRGRSVDDDLFEDEGSRVDLFAVDQDFVVQMVVGRDTGPADQCNLIPTRDALSDLNQHFRAVRIPGSDALTVVDRDDLAVAGLQTDVDDASVGRCRDGRSAGCAVVPIYPNLTIKHLKYWIQ